MLNLIGFFFIPSKFLKLLVKARSKIEGTILFVKFLNFSIVLMKKICIVLLLKMCCDYYNFFLEILTQFLLISNFVHYCFFLKKNQYKITNF